MSIDDNLGFGKYQGLTIRQVYQGTQKLDQYFIQSYLRECIEGNGSKMQVFDISETIIRIQPINNDLEKIKKLGINALLKEGSPWLKANINSFSLDKFYSKEFSNPILPYKTIGNPEYIDWLMLRDDNDLFIIQEEIGELTSLDVCRFHGVDFKYKIDDIYLYELNFSMEKFNFSLNAINKNKQKNSSFWA